MIGGGKKYIFPETRAQALSNAVSLVAILLLSAEFFDFEDFGPRSVGIIHPCGSNESISRPKCDRMRKKFIFPESRAQIRSNAVSLVPILLLRAEFFDFEDLSIELAVLLTIIRNLYYPFKLNFQQLKLSNACDIV